MTIGFRDRDIGKFDKFSWRDGSESTMQWMTQEMVRKKAMDTVNAHNPLKNFGSGAKERQCKDWSGMWGQKMRLSRVCLRGGRKIDSRQR